MLESWADLFTCGPFWPVTQPAKVPVEARQIKSAVPVAWGSIGKSSLRIRSDASSCDVVGPFVDKTHEVYFRQTKRRRFPIDGEHLISPNQNIVRRILAVN